MPILLSFAFPSIGYLSGSLPFAIWITRFAKNTDVRDQGSGHASTTNTIRKAGFGWGALVFILDVAKGFLPTYLALIVGRDAIPPYIIPFTAACAIIGHCFPIFAQFRGGMGLATFGGTLLAAHPIAFFTGIGLLLVLILITRHRARASALAGLLLAPALWLFDLRGNEFWIALAGGIVIAYRFFSDWNRQYHGL